MTPLPAPLSASQLDAYLDQTEAALEQQHEAELDPDLIRTGLKTAMDSQPFRADTLGSVRRLFRLWLRAGDPAAALRVIDGDGREALAAVPAVERPDWELSMAFWRLEPLAAQRDEPSLRQALEAALERLKTLPEALQYDKAWDYLDEQAVAAGAQDISRRATEARNALQRLDPERVRFRAWDDALMTVRLAKSFAVEGLDTQAREAGLGAIDILGRAQAGQDVDHNDWLRIGHALLPIVPEAMAGVVARVRPLIPASTVFFARRDIDVRIARLEALTFHRQGALEQALALMPLARVTIIGDDDDRYSASALDFLMEAGKDSEAAQLAFESAFHERQISAGHAVLAAQRAVDAGLAGQPYWELALAFGGMADDTAFIRGDETEAAYVAHHLALARAQAPSHPAADAVEAMYLIKSAQDYQRALPLLETAARELSLAHSGVLLKLWVARMRVHGVPAGLAMPFVPASSAGSCYNLAVNLGYHLAEHLPEGTDIPAAQADALAARYYEMGLARFEAFVMSGSGSVRDGHAHTYSMLCNNLAIHYRYDKADPAAALALHHKGIAASPFAEHYQGVMNCHQRLGNDSAVADSAEQLWHFAADHGYSRHDPTNYIVDAVAALHRLGRDTDIAIWLQRLDDWWAGVDDSERADEQNSYTRALVSVLYYLAKSQPEDASLRLEGILPSVPAAASPYTSRVAADVLRDLGQFERSQAMYREGLRYIKSGDEWHETQRTAILQNLDDCKRLQRAAKPWWKVW